MSWSEKESSKNWAYAVRPSDGEWQPYQPEDRLQRISYDQSISTPQCEESSFSDKGGGGSQQQHQQEFVQLDQPMYYQAESAQALIRKLLYEEHLFESTKEQRNIAQYLSEGNRLTMKSAVAIALSAEKKPPKPRRMANEENNGDNWTRQSQESPFSIGIVQQRTKGLTDEQLATMNKNFQARNESWNEAKKGRLAASKRVSIDNEKINETRECTFQPAIVITNHQPAAFDQQLLKLALSRKINENSIKRRSSSTLETETNQCKQNYASVSQQKGSFQRKPSIVQLNKSQYDRQKSNLRQQLQQLNLNEK